MGRTLRIYAFALLTCHALFALDPNRNLSQYIVTRWGAGDALPAGAVNAIAQTPDGFLWIGSDTGLVRWDGISFRMIDHANSPSLPPGPVLGLAVDPEGVLWVRMQSPYLMRYLGGRFQQMYPEQVPPPFTAASQAGATAITRGTTGDILIDPSSGPLRYSAGRFTPLVSSGSAGGLALSIAETSDHAVWIGLRDNGLICVRAGHASKVTGLPDQKVNALLPVAGPELWIGTDAGLVRCDGSTITRRGVPATLARSPILALARDRDSNVWVSTPGGIVRIDSSGSATQKPVTEMLGVIHAIFEDREGSLWLGGTKGLMQLHDAPFLTYSGVAPEGGSVYVDVSGRAWVAPSSGGLLWIRGAEQHSVSGLGLEHDEIYSISGGPGEVWLGRKFGGVTRLREQDGILRAQTYTAADGLAPGTVHAVYRAGNETVWAGSLGGAISRIQNGRITTFTSANGLTADAVNTIEETPDGVIWAGTAGGLDAFRNGNWRTYRGEDGLPPGGVNTLAVDREGILWIGSSAGLFYWSGTQIESARNVPDSLRGAIFGLAADRNGGLWASTDRSVLEISRASLLGKSNAGLPAREFGMADGLPSTRGIKRDHAAVNDPSGRIWFCLQDGISVVNPSRPGVLAPALVHVESVVVDGTPLTGSAPSYPSNRQRVVFNFVGLSLAVPWRVRYRYLLEGYDHNWSEPTQSREAAYTNLPPARYTFRVMAANSEGLWNGSPASVSLEVVPMLWQTWWFRLIALGLLAAAMFVGFRYRLARVRAAMNLRFEERLAERTRIAQELHDTLLQGFISASMQVHVAVDMLPDDAASRPLLTRALQLMKQVIEEGRNTVRGLRASGVSVPLENALSHTVEELGASAEAGFRVIVAGEPRSLHPLLQDEVYRIGREALINAFRHAKARHIEVELRYDPESLRLFVRDDGVGIDEHVLEAGRQGHWGLVGMRERAERIGAEFHVFSGPSAGTEIRLDVPSTVAFRGAGR
jgi:signal transduction histidine kinase/ligand-binding sensor domain-containing protein